MERGWVFFGQRNGEKRNSVVGYIDNEILTIFEEERIEGKGGILEERTIPIGVGGFLGVFFSLTTHVGFVGFLCAFLSSSFPEGEWDPSQRNIPSLTILPPRRKKKKEREGKTEKRNDPRRVPSVDKEEEDLRVPIAILLHDNGGETSRSLRGTASSRI